MSAKINKLQNEIRKIHFNAQKIQKSQNSYKKSSAICEFFKINMFIFIKFCN